MQRAWDAHFSTPDQNSDGLVGYAVEDDYRRYEHHRGKLVELGAVLKLDYEFQHIWQPSDEGNDVTRIIMAGEAASCIDFRSPYPSVPEPMQLTVWCYPEDKPDWDRLAEMRDVPDYREKFMK